MRQDSVGQAIESASDDRMSVLAAAADGKPDLNLKDPSAENIKAALERCGDSGYVVIAKAVDPLTYVQATGSTKTGFTIEHQEGSAQNHYIAKGDLSAKTAIAILQAYASGGAWKDLAEWEYDDFRERLCVVLAESSAAPGAAKVAKAAEAAKAAKAAPKSSAGAMQEQCRAVQSSAGECGR